MKKKEANGRRSGGMLAEKGVLSKGRATPEYEAAASPGSLHRHLALRPRYERVSSLSAIVFLMKHSLFFCRV